MEFYITLEIYAHLGHNLSPVLRLVRIIHVGWAKVAQVLGGPLQADGALNHTAPLR